MFSQVNSNRNSCSESVFQKVGLGFVQQSLALIQNSLFCRSKSIVLSGSRVNFKRAPQNVTITYWKHIL